MGTENRLEVIRTGGGGVIFEQVQFLFRMMKKVLEMHSGDGQTTVCT